MKKFIIISSAIMMYTSLLLSGCSSADSYNYNDSNTDISPTKEYYPATLQEFVAIYQEMKDKGCKRYTNDPTYVYTCDNESLTINNLGPAGRMVKFCAYWGNKEYCSKGSTTRW